MLYADEDPGEGLVYKCRICNQAEKAQVGNEFENCVYKTDLEAKLTELVINPDIVDDPTLQKRAVEQCNNVNCTNKEVVTFYHITSERMALMFVCTKCKEYWRKKEKDE